MGATPTGDWDLVGRSEELGLIDELRLDRRGVLLSGEAGTGKSRLAREAARRAEEDGWQVVTVSATAASKAVPYAALAGILPSPTDVRWLDVLERFRDLHREHGRVALLVDDVNLLDDLSMAILHRCLVEDVIFLIGTVRSGDDGGPDVVALWKDLGVTRLDVRELSRTETTAMVASGLGGDVEGVTARDIWSVTKGIPLYVRELVTAARADGTLTDDTGLWMATGPLTTPGSLRGMILERIVTMSTEARRAGGLLAVAGTLDLEDLVELVSADAVAEIEQAGIATVLPGNPPTVGLAHPLHGEVLRAEMSGTESLSATADRIRTLEGRDDLSEPQLIALASWKLQMGVVDGSLVDRAAHTAHKLGDFGLAERLADEAWRAGEVRSGMLLAQIKHERGDHEGADLLNRHLAELVDDAGLGARLAVQRSVNAFFGLGDVDGALAALDGRFGDELELNRAWLLINMGRIGDADAVTRAAQRRSDPLVWSVTRAWVEALGPDPERALEYVATARSLRPPTDLPSRFRDFPDIPATLALIAMGQLGAAGSLARSGLEDSIDRHPMFIRAWWHLLLGIVDVDRGRVDSAAASFERGAALQRSMNQPGLLAWYRMGAALARSQSRDGATGTVDRTERDVGAEQLFDGLLTEADAWSTSHTDPASAIDGLVGKATATRSNGLDWMARRLDLAALRLGGTAVHPGPMHPRRNLENALADANRHPDTDKLTRAAQAAEAVDMQLVAAEIWARLSVAARRAGDQRTANQALRSHESARSRCESALTGRLVVEDTVDPLTERERQVLTLAASGTPSRAIAERLDVSIRTVNNQIQRAYVKLGVSSRAEAAEALGIDVAGA